MPERAFTQWSPDTCGCVLQYYNDDNSYKATVKMCPKHATHGNSSAHLDAVLAHNREKNYVHKHLLDTIGVDNSEPDQKGTKVLPPEIKLGYDPGADPSNDPVLIVGLTNEHKQALSGNFTQAGRGQGSPIGGPGGSSGTLSTENGDIAVMVI